MKKNPLVSIVIPMKNPDIFLEKCLKTIKQQTYKNIEIVIVSGKVLGVEVLAAKYGARVFEFEPKLSSGRFDATHRRNYGVKKAKGKYLYYADTDYELTKNVIKECVLCADGGLSHLSTLLEQEFGHEPKDSKEDVTLATKLLKPRGSLEKKSGINWEDWMKILLAGEMIGISIKNSRIKITE